MTRGPVIPNEILFCMGTNPLQTRARRPDQRTMYTVYKHDVVACSAMLLLVSFPPRAFFIPYRGTKSHERILIEKEQGECFDHHNSNKLITALICN
jgi:hypothetical protein